MAERDRRRRPRPAVPDGPDPQQVARQGRPRHPAQGARRRHENGADQRQLPAGADPVRQIGGGKGAPRRRSCPRATAPRRCRRRRARSSATISSSSRTCRASSRTTRAPRAGSPRAPPTPRRPRSATARCRARISFSPRGRWASIPGRCRATTSPASTRSSSPTARSNPTSCAASAMAMRRRCSAACRGFAFDEMAQIL